MTTVSLAREFDEKLEVLRSAVCEPSKLGTGLRTITALNNVEGKFRSLLAEVNQINESLTAQLTQMEQTSSYMADVIDDFEHKLDEVDGD